MKNKKIFEYELDGNPVYVEIEDTGVGIQRAGRTRGVLEKNETKFTKAIAHVKPADMVSFDFPLLDRQPDANFCLQIFV